MSAGIHFRAAASETGMTEILNPSNSTSEGLELGLLTLAAGQSHSAVTAGLEAVLVVLSGLCDVEAAGARWQGIGGRANVFAGRAATVYVPAGCEYHVRTEGGCEVAVIRAPSAPVGEPYLIAPEDIEVVTRGSASHRREVHTILGGSRPAGSLLVGETFNEAGAWSSYPPHKHDVDDLPRQALLQEVYHFRLDPAQGFGFQRVYSPERDFDAAYVIQNGDSVLIPFGYHPVVAAAGYRLYYLWALAGKGRELKMLEDPAHEWISHGS